MVTNLELKNAYPGTHATSNAAFLSAATAKWTESSDYYLGTTVDQIAAQHIGQETRLPSLELAMDLLTTVGQCDNGYACVYQNNLSWSSPTTPLPAEAHPRVAFERLFGDGGSVGRPARRAAQERQPARLGDAKISRACRRSSAPATAPRSASIWTPSAKWSAAFRRPRPQTADSHLPDLDRPVGVPAAYADHAQLMFDLQVLALQGDVTRVITFQLARETSTRTYPEIGVPEPHHPLTHNGGDPEKLAKVAKINAFHVSLFAYFLEKLKATPDGNGSLLDHSHLPVRQRHGQSRHARPRQPADPGRRRRRGQAQGRPSHPLRGADAAGQSAPDAAGQSRRPPGLLRRQPAARSRNCSSRFRCDMTLRLASLMLAGGMLAAAADTRLADAAKKADRAAVRALLAQHADVNAPQVDGTTALHWAANQDDLETARTADPRRRQREGREPLRRDAALAGLHQRQRRDGRAAAEGRRRRRTPPCPAARPR